VSRARPTLLLAAALAVTGCTGSSAKPGAILRGPGALAIFDGIVSHDGGAMRTYLAVGNERGDELRLVDVADNEVVESPGLVFPLSIPTPGRPLMVVSADLGDGLPDALAVVSAGTTEVSVIDTWSGVTSVSQSIALPDGEVLAMAAVTVPSGALPQARLVVSLSGGRIEIIDLFRGFTDTGGLTWDDGVTATRVTVPPNPLTFDLSSLAPGAAPGTVYAGSIDPGFGVSEFALPAVLPGSPWSLTVASLATDVGIAGIAVASFLPWDWSTGTFGGSVVERVIAAPVESECGEGRAVRCGLLSIDAASLTLAPSWIPGGSTIPGDEPYLIPLALPAPVTALLASGRAEASIPVTPGSESGTSAVVIAATADGAVYPIDLPRWRVASPSPLTGDAGTRVSAGTSDEVAGSSQIALWGLNDELPSAKGANLTGLARVKVTPGFTPDDDWALTWQGAIPGLDTRGALLGSDASGPWLAVQVEIGTGTPVAVADLTALDVRAGDTVELSGGEGCPAGTVLEVSSVDTGVAGAAGGAVRFASPLPGCLPTAGSTVTEVATFRAGGLILVGARSGYAGRPTLSADAAIPPSEHVVDYVAFPGRFLRRFYVTDAAGSAEAATWEAAPFGLTFPFPSGPAVALRPAFVTVDATDASESPTLTPPTRAGTALRFTTRSGIVAGQRRPLADGTAIASTLPSGLALIDPGTGGVKAYTSYTAGLVMIFETDKSAATIAVVR